MHPLLMDAVVVARQDELRRAACTSRTSRLRVRGLVRNSATGQDVCVPVAGSRNLRA